jgi:hypothetical protein
MEKVTSGHFSIDTDSPHIQNLVSDLRQLPFYEQFQVLNMVNGREFPYPLSCPNNTAPSSQHYSIVVSYHVGMVQNWRNIVLDQMTTLETCGLGNTMKNMIITYTQHDSDNTLEELTQIMSRYSFASKITYQMGPHVIPYEGPALNALRDYCVAQHNAQEETVAFYFHNKGCTHYQGDWRDEAVLNEWGSYAYVLFWRKYLEYFLLERPQICIDQIVQHGAAACGAHLIDSAYYGDLYYSGNFWAASCSHLQSLPPVTTEIVDGSEDQWYRLYINGERWIGAHSTHKSKQFVNLHNNTQGLYKHLISPDEYSDFSYRWK